MYVTGTPMYQSYDKTGRIFQKIGQLRTFLTGVMTTDEYMENSGRITNWEIVEIEMVVREVKEVHEIITAKKLKELLMK